MVAALRDVIHHDQDPLCTRHEIHGPARALHHRPRDHPVGEIARGGNLHRTQDRQIDVASPNHREALGATEVAGSINRGDRFLARVDEVGVDFGLRRIGADAQQAVLALEENLHTLRDQVGAEGGDADAEVDVVAVPQLAGGARGNLFAGQRHSRVS